MLRIISNVGMGTYHPRSALALCTISSQSAVGQWDWGFHTVWGGFDAGDHRFRSQVVRIVKGWNYF